MKNLFKKDKPIMTKTKHSDYLLLTEEGQLNILNGLSSENKERIGVWLDNVEVKENVDGEPYIASPFWGTIYIYKDLSYLILYEWCAVNFERIGLVKLPKPLDAIIYYANKWKLKPSINPYTNKDISISLNPNGEYVQLYIKIMKGLVSNILETKTNKTSKVLSVEECHKIKYSLPNEHACVFSDRSTDIYQIYYDYLFIVYFIKSKTIQYDTKFQSEPNIYLDIAVYNTSNFIYNDGEIYTDFNYTCEYLYIRKFLKNYLLNMSESEISIQVLVMNLCSDIEKILIYMREPKVSKIASDIIEKVYFNLNVLKYCKAIFEKIPFKYVEEYLTNPQQKNENDLITEFLLLELTEHKGDVPERYKDIYDTIMIHMKYEYTITSNVFETFISIYISILKLYSDNKFYKNYIKDPYHINKNAEPKMPIKPQLPRELQLYNFRLNKLEGAVKTAKAKSSKEKKEIELNDFKRENLSNDRKLKVYDEFVKIWEQDLKEYERKLKEYDEYADKWEKHLKEYHRIYEGKYSPKKHKEPLLQASRRKAKSEGIRPKSEYSEYSGNLKALTTLTTLGNMKKPSYSSSYNEVSGYYINDIDPYTREVFSDMHPKKQKYSSDIVYKDGKTEYHYRFDTISIYNYILKCIDVCDKPINFFNRTALTADNLDEICAKIKHFTKKPTYNSSSDITPLLQDCRKYDNLLQLSWDEIKEEQDKEREIIGVINVYLYINLGDIIFKVIPQKVLTLPIFNTNILKTFPNHTLMMLEEKLSVGELIGSRFFPYRTTKLILNLPKFAFNLTDKAIKTSERLKKYNKKIEQM